MSCTAGVLLLILGAVVASISARQFRAAAKDLDPAVVPPGLSRTALIDNRDLRPTLDLRSVFKALLDEPMHVDANTLAKRAFPESGGARPLQRLIRA